MKRDLLPAPSALPEFITRRYKYIRLEWNDEFSLLRLRTRVTPIQCYSLAAMAELQYVGAEIATHPGLVKHYVMSSDVAGIFNFGGDLALFVLLIRARDVESLRMYARRCVELVWWLEIAAQRGVHTTVLVQGDTLGGGLESVLPFHTIIFERSAQAGFPEVLFNLFPGMGAWNLTVRRSGFAVANEMILSGRLYSAQELHARCLVDRVVDDGQGEAAVLDAVRAVHPRLRGTLAALRARALAAPVTRESMLDIVELWVGTAMTLTDRDLKLMERLARAQLRKAGGGTEGAVDEIKRLELDTAWHDEEGRQSVWAETSTGITEWAGSV